MTRLLPALWLLLPVPVVAGEVRDIEVTYHRNIYTLNMDADVHAGRDAVYAIVTDYDRLHRISDLLVSSNALPSPVPGHERRRLVTESCVLVFCFKAVMVEDVERLEAGVIRTTIVPELSDYRTGHSEWRITSPEPGRTRVRFACVLEPDFWVPPVIGPWLIKSKLRKAATVTIGRLETLAGEAQ